MDLHTTPAGKIIGQMFNSYIVVEAADGVYIYDQHALAERIIYEKLAGSSYAAATQGLLVAESMVLTAKEYSIVLDHLGVFQEMGFDIEDVGNHSILINGIPDFIKKERVSEVVSGVIQDIGEEGWTKSTALQEVRNKIFAYTACRSAIKFGHKLSVFEMHALLEDAFMDYSATCPHGRPVVFSVSLDELKGRYER
ncbi:MAG: hypothetical protein H6767_06195 [Candidatus Peribacteria bacterium]|nr:MAG: hypothetical protein H6767_06195 [Candidatus Peribacteria bacterium]